MRQRLDQLEIRALDERDQALRDLLVVERVRDVVAGRGAGAIYRHLDVEHDGLLRPALPFDEADDAVDREAVQEDAVTLIRRARDRVGLGLAGYLGSRHV